MYIAAADRLQHKLRGEQRKSKWDIVTKHGQRRGTGGREGGIMKQITLVSEMGALNF